MIDSSPSKKSGCLLSLLTVIMSILSCFIITLISMYSANHASPGGEPGWDFILIIFCAPIIFIPFTVISTILGHQVISRAFNLTIEPLTKRITSAFSKSVMVLYSPVILFVGINMITMILYRLGIDVEAVFQSIIKSFMK